MKKIFFYATLISLFSCGTSRVITDKERGDVENWKISDTIAQKMIKRLNSCGLFKPCRDNSKVIDPNNENYLKLVSAYGKENVTNVDGRYRHADRHRYCELRGFEDHKRCKVKGYKTQIVKVELPTGSMFAVTNYYDLYTIKPPPEED